MPGGVKQVVVTLSDDASLEKVVERLREAGLQNLTKLARIRTILGEWNRSLDELQKISGVATVEEQMSGYYPS